MLAPVSFFKLLKLLKLQDISTLAVGRYMHKIIYKNKASFILDDINKLQVIPSQSLRNRNDIRLPNVQFSSQLMAYCHIFVVKILATKLKPSYGLIHTFKHLIQL